MHTIIFSHGAVGGAVAIGGVILSLALAGGEGGAGILEILGYVIMLVALSVIFVGVKRFRDQDQGGVITFGRALAMGVGIAAVAGAVYVTVWEAYLVLTDYAFVDDYVASIIAAREAAGVSAPEMEAVIAETEQIRASYANPVFRLSITFLEIFPVGFLVALVSAALLRRARFMPATHPPGGREAT